MDKKPTYDIIRAYDNPLIPDVTLRWGVSEEEAREWVTSPEARSTTCKDFPNRMDTHFNGPWEDIYRLSADYGAPPKEEYEPFQEDEPFVLHLHDWAKARIKRMYPGLPDYPATQLRIIRSSEDQDGDVLWFGSNDFSARWVLTEVIRLIEEEGIP